jgi:hypothetical protein
VIEHVNKKGKSASSKRLAMRDSFWPGLTSDVLWLRKERAGFTTIPRTMPLIGRILDHLSGKGFPLYSTYLALWCRVYDEAFVEIRNDREIAFEAGFSGTRGEVTWRTRMRKLQELGFIDIKAGLASDLQYVLLFNPLIVIAEIYRRRKLSEDATYMALMTRLIEVGADDLEDLPPAKPANLQNGELGNIVKHKINVHEKWELDYWTRALGVTEHQLIEAMKKFSPNDAD